jgi:hypothetical protein
MVWPSTPPRTRAVLEIDPQEREPDCNSERQSRQTEETDGCSLTLPPWTAIPRARCRSRRFVLGQGHVQRVSLNERAVWTRAKGFARSSMGTKE